MTELEIIDKEIADLNDRLPRIKGRKTEVYSRIVGYYRSVGNWNQGKRSEFDERRVYDVPDLTANMDEGD